jgi:hypothetical protein
MLSELSLQFRSSKYGTVLANRSTKQVLMKNFDDISQNHLQIEGGKIEQFPSVARVKKTQDPGNKAKRCPTDTFHNRAVL